MHLTSPWPSTSRQPYFHLTLDICLWPDRRRAENRCKFLRTQLSSHWITWVLRSTLHIQPHYWKLYIRCPSRLTRIRPAPNPPSFDDPSMYNSHFGSLVVGVIGTSLGRLSFGVVSSTMKFARACPFITGSGTNLILNWLSSIAHLSRRPESFNFWRTCLKG